MPVGTPLGYRDGMRGTRDEDPAGDTGEVYIVSPDGMDGGGGGAPASSRRPGPTGRQAALLAVVGLLAFGIGVGVGNHRGDDSAAAAAASSAAPLTSGQPSAATTAADRDSSASADGSTQGASGPEGASSGEPSSAAREPWPTVAGACGYETPAPLISGTLPLGGATGLTVLAGGAPSRLAVDGGASGERLFPSAVEALAADSDGLVAITTSELCPAGPTSAAVSAFRLGGDGATTRIFPTAYSRRANLQVWGIVSGGNRAWLAAAPPYDPEAPAVAPGEAPADTHTLIAADGSGDSVTLPASFMPTAGWRGLIIGYYLSSADGAAGPIQIYDLASGGIIAQIAATSPQMVGANGHIAWVDGACQARCVAHRYDVDTGTRFDVPVTLPDSGYGGVGSFVALSPDGRRVAMVSYDAEPDARYELGHPGGPARFAVLDLDSGELTHLPGVLRAPKTQAGMAFSPDGRWLAVAVNNGAETRVLLYDHDLRGPYDPRISVPASTAWAIPLVVEQR